jgi:RsiW-degrading membrane proteinase PrsW (M82 family)
MAGTVRTRSRLPHVTLNSDGQPHLLVNILTIFTLVVGLVSFVLGLIIRNVPSADSKAMAVTAAVTGLVCLLVGLYAQMISATREQRVLIVTGLIAGFVGLALGLGHGGFS